MNIQSAHDLKNTLLIAMPSMLETWFGQSLILICDHDLESSMGLVVNKPLGMQLGELYEQMDIELTDMNLRGLPVFKGGPMHNERGFVLHTKHCDTPGMLKINDNLFLSTSKDVLVDIAQGKGPDKFLVALGYASWGEQQLTDEIFANAWLNAPVDEELIFDRPVHYRWEEAAQHVGVDIRRLTAVVGHA